MNFEYCRQWQRWKKKPCEPLDLDTAQELHESRQPYTALAYDTCGIYQPAAYLQFQEDSIQVGILDGLRRDYLCYQLLEKAPGKLFVTKAMYQTYRGRSDAFELCECYTFGEDGTVTLEKRDFESPEATTITTNLDAWSNWERYPTFGYYEPLLEHNWIGKLAAI